MNLNPGYTPLPKPIKVNDTINDIYLIKGIWKNKDGVYIVHDNGYTEVGCCKPELVKLIEQEIKKYEQQEIL